MQWTHPANAVCLVVDRRFRTEAPRIKEMLKPYVNNIEFFVDGTGVILERDFYNQLPQHPPPGWKHGQGSWQNFLGMKGIVKRAKDNGWDSVLIVEDDCILTDAFSEIVSKADVPSDWDLLYYGGNHSNAVTNDVGQHVMRVTGTLTLHMTAVRNTVYDAILNLQPYHVLDNLIARYIQPRFNAYSLWPSVAVQKPGYSYLWLQQVDYGQYWKNQGINR